MKVIIPAAGLGTRMLPVTKVIPKELLLVDGKPAIRWTLEEAVRAGLREVIVAISRRKTMLRDYLTATGAAHLYFGRPEMEELEGLLRALKIRFVEQNLPLGLGDALLRCRQLIADQPFALMMPDNVFARQSQLLQKLIETYRAYGKSCVAIWRASAEGLHDGAIIAEPINESMYLIRRVLPKDDTGDQKTDFRPLGRSVLVAAALDYLDQAQGSNGELDDVPLLDGLAREGSLLGVLTTERFQHLGITRRSGANQLQ